MTDLARRFLLGLGVAALTSCASLQAPEPPRQPASPLVASPAPSTWDLNLTVPHSLPAWNETGIPTSLSGKDSAMRTLSAWFLKHDWHYWWSYDLQRSPMTLTFVDNRVRVATAITGTLKGWWDTLPGESLAEVDAEAGVEAVLTLQPGWSVKASTQTYLEVNHAEVPVGITWDGTFFGETISIAAPVREALRPSLAQLGKGLESTLVGWTLKPSLESAWREAQTAVSWQGEDGTWLALNPLGLSTGPLKPNAEALEATVRMVVSPEIGRGPQPARDLPLPQGVTTPATREPPSEGLRLDLPITFDWDTALRTTQGPWLTKEPWTSDSGSKVRLTDLRAATDGTRVLLRATAVLLPPWPSAETTAVFWITGKLVTLGGARVALRDLALETASRVYLEAKAPWLGAPTWLTSLENTLVWDLQSRVDAATERAVAQLTQLKVGPHLTLHAAPKAEVFGLPGLSERGPTVVLRLTGPASLTWAP